jgi:predicted NBD/HSP70 family sugar kinase/biotin operon repressor
MEEVRGLGSLEALRSTNRVKVVQSLRRNRTISRADIARDTGLSRTTVSSLVADLLRDGFVVEREQPVLPDGPRPNGRPPVLLALDHTAGVALGVDFGHSHLRVALGDLSSRVIGELEREIDVDRAGATALDAAAALAFQLLDEAGIDPARLVGAGMGLSGPIDHAHGRVHTSEILHSWVGVDAQAEMETRLGVPVRLENDANLGALAEAAFGAGRGASNLIYLMMSSGIGAGLFLDGRLFRGGAGMAGEIGHVLVDETGPLCRCGNRGCLETLAAGPPLAAVVSHLRGESFSVETMIALALEGDLGARRVIGDAGRITGRAIADVCNVLNPELVVVGGRLATAGDVLLEPIRESIGRYAIPAAAKGVRVVEGVLGDRAEVLGALSLVTNQADPLFATPLSAPQAS